MSIEASALTPARALRRAFSVAWLLSTREWVADYRRSRLSALWPLVHPLAYSALFVLLRPVIATPGGGVIPFAVYVFVGFCLWQTWIEVLRAQLTAVRRHKGLMSRGELGAGTLMLSTTLSAGIQMAPRLLLAAVASASLLHSSLLAIAGLLFFGTLALLNGSVIGALLQPFATLSPDIDRIVQSISLALLVTAGVFIPLPEQPPLILEALVTANPVGALLDVARAPLFGDAPLNWSGPLFWTTATLLAAACLPSLGRRLLPIVVERMGN